MITKNVFIQSNMSEAELRWASAIAIEWCSRVNRKAAELGADMTHDTFNFRGPKAKERAEELEKYIAALFSDIGRSL